MNYFEADGKGVSKTILNLNQEFIMEIIELNNIKTDLLIKNYKNSTFKNPKIRVRKNFFFELLLI